MASKTIRQILASSQSHLANVSSFLGDVEAEAIMHPLNCKNPESVDDIVILVGKVRVSVYEILKLIRQIEEKFTENEQ